MKLPKIAIENYQFTVIVVVLLVLSGVISFLHMPRSEDPPVAKPGASVVVLYPGAGPADLEQLAVSPLEEALNELEDIKRISSTCEDGLAVVHVEFLAGCDPDEKFSDVNDKVNGLRTELPADILSLTTTQWTIEDTNFLQLAIVSDSAGYREMEKMADRLKKSLERLGGVRRIETWAFPRQEVRISVNTEKLAQLRLPLDRLIEAVRGANMNVPGGTVDAGSQRFVIQTSGSYESLAQIENTVIHTDGSKIVYLKDVAEVFLGYEDNNYFARFNGQRAVFVTVNQKARTNIFAVMERIETKIVEFERRLPPAMKLYYVFNQSESVSNRLNGFFTNLLQGIALVGIVILLAIGLRGSLIVILAIPLSIFMAIGFVDLSGYGLQQMSIAGLVITLGLLVDNAIVVTENISRFLRLGEDKRAASVKGTAQIGWAIVSATATTVLAFLPIAMMQDVSGDFIRSMPVTVIFTLAASLFIALTFTPYLSFKILKSQQENRVQRLISRFIRVRYRSALDFALRRPGIVILLALAVFVGSLALFPLVGVSFFPKAEKNQFFIDITTPKGTNIDRTDRVTRYVESVLKSRQEVKSYAANIGRGNPQIYYNVIERRRRSTIAHVFVQFQDIPRQRMQSLIRELRAEFDRYAGARIEIKELEQGPPVEAAVEIKILGDNNDVLKELAAGVETIFKQTPGLINIHNPLATTKTDIQVRINREKAAMLGVPLAAIDRTVRLNIAGLTVSEYRDQEGKEYDMVVRSRFSEKPGLDMFARIYISSLTGAVVPLDQVAAIELKAGPSQIDHFNLERSATLTADVLSGYSVNRLTDRIVSRLDAYNWPAGYHYYVGGEKESQAESFGGMGKAIIIAVIAIFAVLVLQFKSFRQPLIVFAALPLAIIGSILNLLITGYTFSFTAFIGLTSLVGIVVNNSIILVDYTNQLRRSGVELLAAIKEAGETRFMPIILTTLTTIGGLLPLTLRGGTLWAPMGWTIIGGLLTSTVLTLLVVPVLYKLFSNHKG